MRPIAVIFLFIVMIPVMIQGGVIWVPDQSPNIQAAIDKSESGDTVYVRIGTWNESLMLKDGVYLIGESMLETVIRGKKRGPVITAANGSLIKNITIKNGRIGILCENIDCTIDQVMVVNNQETGIHCLVTLPNIFNSVIYRNRWTGIFCESTRSIKTAIMHNVIAENGYCGVMLQGASEVLIQNNVFLGNKQYAVWGAEEARRTRVVYNNFFNNRSIVNLYLTKDMSNITVDPGYPRTFGGYDFFSTSSVILKGRGKDGATIGLIGGEVLTQKLTDPDEDGVAGSNDRCPSIPEDMDGFEDEDGCPEFDNDKDGIFDSEDACPNSTEDYDGFRDDDGCNDFDNDRDGIPDTVDVCKDNPETLNNYKDDDGCPDEVHPESKMGNPAIEPSKSSGTEKETPAADAVVKARSTKSPPSPATSGKAGSKTALPEQ